MIPSVVASQIKQGIEDFLRSTFPITTPLMTGLVEGLLSAESDIFRGPYLSIDLPFRQAVSNHPYFSSISLSFKPYQHQHRAFSRLTGQAPKSTIVATGTGSGKTECFLFPILEHCYINRDRPGIKAIVIYPMNALATDQAKRIAATVWSNPLLKGNVRAGLFVGEFEKLPRSEMSEDMIITNKDLLRENPPDILLTNYKMLDYLLIRPRDQGLWQHNRPGVFKYLVVDELHTFDGAQGTDLACLIRRLKARLGDSESNLVCVGTSATIGGEKTGELLTYVGQVFGEQFDSEAIVLEDRLVVAEFFEQVDRERKLTPFDGPEISGFDFRDLKADSYASYEAYVRAQHRLWTGKAIEEGIEEPGWKVALGEHLLRMPIVRRLLAILSGRPRSYEEILSELYALRADIVAAEEVIGSDKQDESGEIVDLLDSLVALIAVARQWLEESQQERTKREQEGKQRPTLPLFGIRFQLWMRELRRMVAEVSDDPVLRFSDDLTQERREKHLPIVHCNECGSTGWASLVSVNQKIVLPNLRLFYQSYFSFDHHVVFLFPALIDDENPELKPNCAVCRICLKLHRYIDLAKLPDRCSECRNDADLQLVFVPDSNVDSHGKIVGSHDCPFCSAGNSLTILGSQAASLTGVMTSVLFMSPWNDDKKLITFADSVQDAAHRAGFIGNRTAHITFRAALQKCLEAAGGDVCLTDAGSVFADFWLKRMDEAQYVGTFIRSDIEWFREYDQLKATGTVSPELRQSVDQRIGWEITSEYGLRARIGRTLERAGASLAIVDPELLESAVQELHTCITNEVGGLGHLSRKEVACFLLGLLMHIKLQGAISHRALYKFIGSRGSAFILNQRSAPWLPKFREFPRFLTDAASQGSTFEQVLGNRAGRRPWTASWLDKCFIQHYALVNTVSEDIYRSVLNTLVRIGIIQEHNLTACKVWGIKPESLMIALDVSQSRCNRCNHEVAISDREKYLWEDTPCIRYRCSGRYSLSNARGQEYYRKLYSLGEVCRVVARDHSGLLKREVREPLETQFINSNKPWHPNVLCATSTLEMGIDIGDLSSLILTSVPPTQANYLQRIGRAGRRDGNSLALTIANGRPHDLFFFAEPYEMIRGNVRAPGIFLDASAILQRQFTAFCLDQWVASGISSAALPDALETVLNNVERGKNQGFPYDWLDFVAGNEADLFDQFIALFGADEVSKETRSEIKAFIVGADTESDEGSMSWRIRAALADLVDERRSLKLLDTQLRTKLKKLKEDPAPSLNQDEEIAEVARERSAVRAIVKEINERHTLNFFTDEGFIPNYAFPEAGVTLKSVIYRRKQKAQGEQDGEGYKGKRNYETWSYEYARPSSNALSELAPSNFFYAEGRKVRIDQVNLQVSKAESWRLCSTCSYAEKIITDVTGGGCPRCGDQQWSDRGQRHTMLRLRQVLATTNDKNSRILDDSDDRAPAFFNRQLLVVFDPNLARWSHAFQDPEVPFGYEYCRKTTFREINSGEKEIIGTPISIAGQTTPRKGFTLCRHCGKVQPRGNNAQPEHTLSCQARKTDSPSNFIECYYLYREFHSEAIRILLPLTSILHDESSCATSALVERSNSDRILHSFIAGLQLGLRLKFGGKVDHLNTTIYDEPQPNSSIRKKYVVLYDTVPGGTGYLKQLAADKNELLDVFRKAFDHLKACTCNKDAAKDGCYRCLYAYRNSYDMPLTSRNQAVDSFHMILSRAAELVESGGLSALTIHRQLESELEVMFIETLKSWRFSDGVAVDLRKDLVNGKAGYVLRVGDRKYHIEPQVYLKEEDGIGVPCRADFVFWPSRSTEAAGNARPIVVFVDGFEYHHNRIPIDSNQRMAIARSGKYLVWSLPWDDIAYAHGTGQDYCKDFIASLGNAVARNKAIELLKIQPFLNYHTESSWMWFVRYLHNPDESLWQRFALATVFSFVNNQLAEATWKNEHTTRFPREVVEDLGLLSQPRLYGRIESPAPDGSTGLLGMFAVSQRGATGVAEEAHTVLLFSDDFGRDFFKEYRKEWVGFWKLANVCQLLPNTIITSISALVRNQFRHSPLKSAAGMFEASDAQWNEVLEMALPEVHRLVQEAHDRKWAPPVVGFELQDSGGAIIGEAEIAWSEKKLVVVTASQVAYKGSFEANGWKVILASEALPDGKFATSETV